MYIWSGEYLPKWAKVIIKLCVKNENKILALNMFSVVDPFGLTLADCDPTRIPKLSQKAKSLNTCTTYSGELVHLLLQASLSTSSGHLFKTLR